MSIPLTVIGGFLGAGKTTLLNHWLRHAGGKRFAVLVNDFGAMNIDAALIESTAADTVALTNGCVCCQIGDDLSMALLRVLDGETRFDGVVIEASGVSDPWRIAQLGRADPGLMLDGVIVLVDAGAVLEHSRDPLLADTLVRQLMAADLVVLNKCDLIDVEGLARVGSWIESIAGQVPRFETTDAEVPMAMLSGLAMPEAVRHEHDVADCDEHASGNAQAQAHAHAHDDPHHGALFDTWSSRPSAALDITSLRAWIANAPAGLLRLKGVLRTIDANGTESWSQLQFAGRHGSLKRASPPADDASSLVAIGLRGRLPGDTLTTYFNR